MNIVYDSMQGPLRCTVVREIDSDRVRLKPRGNACGTFGNFNPMVSEFETNKWYCWKSAKALNQYGTRHELTGRPEWSITK